MKEILGKIKNQALEEIEKAKSTDELYSVQVKYLGRKGELTLLMQGIKDLPNEEKTGCGKNV